MGGKKSKVLIELKQDDLQELTKETHFNEKEIKSMYQRYWGYCSNDGTVNKQQFYTMFHGAAEKGRAIFDHIFRTTDTDDSLSLGMLFTTKLEFKSIHELTF